MPVESTRCAAAVAPVHPNVSPSETGAMQLVFELHDQYWDCECCGGIYDMELVLRVNGAGIRYWYEDGHFGNSRINWPDALALAMAHAGVRLTVHPPADAPDTGPYTLVTWPADGEPAWPVPTREVVWRSTTEATPAGGDHERIHVHLDGQPVTVWREEERWDDPMGEQGPVLDTLRALGVHAQAITIDPPTDDDGKGEVPNDDPA